MRAMKNYILTHSCALSIGGVSKVVAEPKEPKLVQEDYALDYAQTSPKQYGQKLNKKRRRK